MQLIRNLFQTLRYLATSSADDRIERQITRLRLGLTDAERREEARRTKVSRAVWQLAVVFLLSLYVVGKLSA